MNLNISAYWDLLGIEDIWSEWNAETPHVDSMSPVVFMCDDVSPLGGHFIGVKAFLISKMTYGDLQDDHSLMRLTPLLNILTQ